MNNHLTTQDSTAAVMQTDGDLVASRLPALRAEMREKVRLGVISLTVDLASTNMVDSAGIGLLISAHNSLKKVGGELRVVHASAEILDLFRSMRIQQHFSVSGY